MPLFPIRGLGRLEFWFSFGTHHDTGPGRPDVPTTETLLPCQPRYGMNEIGIVDLEEFQMTKGLPRKSSGQIFCTDPETIQTQAQRVRENI